MVRRLFFTSFLCIFAAELVAEPLNSSQPSVHSAIVTIEYKRKTVTTRHQKANIRSLARAAAKLSGIPVRRRGIGSSRKLRVPSAQRTARDELGVLQESSSGQTTKHRVKVREHLVIPVSSLADGKKLLRTRLKFGVITSVLPNPFLDMVRGSSPYPNDVVTVANESIKFDNGFTGNEINRSQWSLAGVASSLGSSPVVAVIDSGTDLTHSDLQQKLWVNSREIPGDGIDNDGNGYVDDVHGYDTFDLDATYYYPGYDLNFDTSVYICPSPFNFPNNNCCDPSVEDCRDSDGDPSDQFGHGTMVGGLIAAEGGNGAGIVGACPDCRLMTVRAGAKLVNETTGQSQGRMLFDNVISGMIYAIDNGADILNLSFGTYDALLAETFVALDVCGVGCNIFDYAEQRGVLLVAAAGNQDSNGNTSNLPFYPAAFADQLHLDNMISVGAHREDGSLASSYSNFGDWYDITAFGGQPGPISQQSIVSTNIGGIYSHGFGTSYAAAIVSGAAGLLKTKNPALSAKALKTMLLFQSDMISDSAGTFRKLSTYKSFIHALPGDLDGSCVVDEGDLAIVNDKLNVFYGEEGPTQQTERGLTDGDVDGDSTVTPEGDRAVVNFYMNRTCTEQASDMHAFGIQQDSISSTSALGDMNCSGNINLADFVPFVEALANPEGYQQQYPDCQIERADLNQDGSVNGLDIQLFDGILRTGFLFDPIL